jgi:nucleoid DNA-binding protein
LAAFDNFKEKFDITQKKKSIILKSPLNEEITLNSNQKTAYNDILKILNNSLSKLISYLKTNNIFDYMNFGNFEIKELEIHRFIFTKETIERKDI